MILEAWQDIMQFLLPVYSSEEVPSKYNTIKMAIEKLNSFEDEFGNKWDDLMEIQLQKLQTQPLVGKNVKNANDTMQEQLQLDDKSDDGNGNVGCV